MNDWAHEAVQVIGRAELKRLSERSDARGLLQLGSHVALLIATGWLVYQNLETIWLWPAMFVHGVVLIMLFPALHEAIHRTAFHSRALNDGVAFIIGVLIVLPREWFRAFHFAHHRFTQQGDDPELGTSKPATMPQLLWHVSGMSYWVANVRGLFTRAAGHLPERFYATDRVRRGVILEARLALAIYAIALAASIAAGSTIPLWYWIIPALLGQPVLRLYLLCEHAGCPRSFDMLENTRTTYTNSAVRFLTWNGSFHAEHHAWPSIPFHALPAANALIRGKLRTTCPGYVAALAKIWRTMRAGTAL